MKFVIDGIKYHVDKCGEGFPLVALHGFTGNGATWQPFCAKWGSHSTMLMPDLIGHGMTDSPENIDRYSIEAAAHDLKSVLDELEISQTDLLGYSMGGRLALTFTMLYPDRVRKLILESSTPGIRAERDREERVTKDAELARFIQTKGLESFIRFWEGIPLFASLRELPVNQRNCMTSQRLQNNANGLMKSLIGMGTGSQPSWWDQLDKLSSQVLLITGVKDEKFCRIAEEMTTLIKNVEWIAIEDCGHIIHVEKSEKFGTIVSEFLSNT